MKHYDIFDFCNLYIFHSITWYKVVAFSHYCGGLNAKAYLKELKKFAKKHGKSISTSDSDCEDYLQYRYTQSIKGILASFEVVPNVQAIYVHR